MLTKITGVGDGSAPVVNLTFPFLDQDHVKAADNGVPVGLTWTGASQVTFDAPVGSGATWVVYRDTPIVSPLVDYIDGAVLTEADLDLAQKQLLYRVQELGDVLDGNKGDVFFHAGGALVEINPGAIERQHFRTSAAASVLGNPIAVPDTPIDIAADVDGKILLRRGGALMFAYPNEESMADMPVATPSSKGLLPAIPDDATKFLRGDGLFAALPVSSGGGGVTGLARIADRATLEEVTPLAGETVFLGESGREGTFVFRSSDYSAEVAEDTQQGIYVAPSSDPTGASGAWVRHFIGPKSPRWFGAVGNGTTDDAVALQAWLDSGGWLWLPEGQWRSTATLILRRVVRLSGTTYGFDSSEAGGVDEMPGSRILFDADTDGLDVQPSTTLTDPAAVAAAGSAAFTQEGAYGSVIENIGLIGGGGVGSATGVYSRIYFHARNVRVLNFSGKGWDLSASVDAVGDGNSEWGNMSNSTLVDCSAENCGSHGLHIRGRDANTILVSSFNGFGNGGWGVLNESLIGNTFLKPSFHGNDLGSMKMPGATANHVHDPYIEPDAGQACEISSNTVVYGVDISPINTGGTPTIYSSQPRLNKTKFVGSWAPENISAGPEQGLAYLWDGLTLQGKGSTIDFRLYNQSGTEVVRVPANTTNWQVNGTVLANIIQSRGANQAWPGVADGYYAMIPSAANGFMLGGFGTTWDTSLTNRSGVVVAGVKAGTTQFRATQLGLASGSTVVQATSKSTAVTLNASAGRITTHNAALAAAAVVSFTVNNNTVEADDGVILTLKSGNATAGTYRYWVEAVAVGSFRIVIENRSGGSLSEALVFNIQVVKGATA